MKKITNESMQLILKNLMIELSEKEINDIILNLESSLLNLEKLTIFKINEKYDLSKVEPMNFPSIVTSQQLRDDVVDEFKDVDKLLKCSKSLHKNLIKV